VIHEAVVQVMRAGRDEVTGAHLVAALWNEPDSFAVHFLERAGLTRLALLRQISHGSPAAPGDADDADDEDDEEEGRPAGDALERFTVPLHRRAAEGRIDPLIGREAEVGRAIHILGRRRKNNPL